MKYVMACQLDSGCVVEGDEHDDHDEEDRSLEGRNWGLKIGLAAAFLGIGVVSSLIPTFFKNLPSFQVHLPQPERFPR